MSEDNQLFKKHIVFENNSAMLLACGQYDNNLKSLEKKYDVGIYARGNTATVQGDKENVEAVIEELEKLSNSKEKINHKKNLNNLLTTFNGKPIKVQSQNQQKYINAMNNNDLVVAIGPAGTGKTFLACIQAMRRLKSGEVDRIILTRPVVEAGEKLGFLPGDLYEKVNPYLSPLYDSFYSVLGPSKFQSYRKEGIIEVVPLAYMRGRTLDDAMIILDEAQNTTPKQLQMFLTRLGFNSKAVITGDITQVDLEAPLLSGLVELPEVLKGIEGLEFIYFSRSDVIRHPLVKEIVNAYQSFNTDKRI